MTFLCLLLSFSLFTTACNANKRVRELTPSPSAQPTGPQISVVAEGLLGPIGLVALPNGNLLVAEEGTGNRDDSAGVSLITKSGEVGRLISGFSSTRDAGDLAGVPLVGLSPDGGTLYVGHFGDGHLWTLPLDESQQKNGLNLPPSPLTADDLGQAMEPLNNVFLVNPFDITFDPDGVPVVSDATGNGVAKANPDGTTRFIHRFDPLPDLSTPHTSDTIQAVPTGITRIGNEYYVTLTGGCPFPPDGGLLVAIDEERNQRTVVDGLNMPIDVAQGPDGTIWLLEFAGFTPGASCFDGSGYQARTGKLSKLAPDGSLEPVLTELNFPTAILPMPDGSLYMSDLTERVVHITFGQEAAKIAPKTVPPTFGDIPESEFPADLDAALQQVAQTHNLTPYPGVELKTEDTALTRLGQALFFDPILSGDQNISCATCHHPQLAMADARVLPIGTGGQGLGPNRFHSEQVALGPDADANRRLAGTTNPTTGQTTVSNPFVGAFVPRNSLTVLNSALYPTQFWDSRVENYTPGSAVTTQEDVVNSFSLTEPLVAQALFPITSLHEMAGATYSDLAPQTIRTKLLERLRQNSAYVSRFQQAFGGDTPEEAVTVERLAIAIGAFEQRFIFTDSPWDDYLAGDLQALTPQQKQGALLFYGQIKPEVNCAACHSGNLFSDFEHHNLLVPQLGPGKGHDYTGREDWGRAAITFDARQRYAFRTAPLRNSQLTAPYFHDGAFATLEETVRHHANIWHSAANYDPGDHIPPDLFSSLRSFDIDKQTPTVAPELAAGLPLTETDIDALVAFLTSLTDPAARDLTAFTPDSVPSHLPLDPLLTDAELAALVETKSTGSVSELAPDEDAAIVSAGFHLKDIAATVGLDFRHQAFETAIFQDPAAMMGGGLCWLDTNSDGWLDLYLLNSYAEDEMDYWAANGGLPKHGLYRNDGGVFTNVSSGSGTDISGRANGCYAADFDGDGWTDIFVTADGPNALLWNNGDGTFTEGAAAAGLDNPEWNSGVAVGDLNGDGLVDLFMGAYIDLEKQIPRPIGAFPQDYYGLPDHIFVNRGAAAGEKPTFVDVAETVGLQREERALGAIFSDFDLDGDLDLYIANDGHPNRLYANEPWPGGIDADPEGLGFRLVDLVETANIGDSGSGMGVAVGDYDDNGWFDLFITNWEREVNALYQNLMPDENDLTFRYSTFKIGISGLGNNMTGWGTSWADFDHDTDLDLLVVNGRVPVTNLEADRQLVRFYRNRARNLDDKPGQPGRFFEWTQQVGLKDVGPLLGRGSALADFDNDGDLDVAINNIGHPAVLLENTQTEGNWLEVELDGFYPGAVAIATLPDGQRLLREWHVGSSYLSTEDPRFHFGLGNEPQVSHLKIVLPNGSEIEYSDVSANQILKVSVDGPVADGSG